MGEFSKNHSLNREHSFYGKVVCLVHLLFAGAALILLAFGLKSYDDYGGWSVGCLLRFALAVGLFIYYYHSVHKGTGVFYALGLCEQSLLRRCSEDELIRAFYCGERIFVHSREAEVFDGRLVPKITGMKFQSVDESHDETGTTPNHGINNEAKEDGRA